MFLPQQTAEFHLECGSADLLCAGWQVGLERGAFHGGWAVYWRSFRLQNGDQTGGAADPPSSRHHVTADVGQIVVAALLRLSCHTTFIESSSQ